MIRPRTIIVAAVACLTLLGASCGSGDPDDEVGVSEASGEHDGEGTEGEGEHEGEEGSEGSESDSIISDGDEESGIEYARGETYDETRRGARLQLRYDNGSDTFIGTVENTTTEMLEDVRVEVHLSNGTELGPTTPGPLQPGDTANIALPAEGGTFEAWSAHPEVGREEHGEEGEGGEHQGEGEESGDGD